jgi:H+/gluconate symporter-like permease
VATALSFAPIAALGAVLLTDPSAVAPAFTGVFMEKMVGFIKLYFPVFLLGAVFGKLIELSGSRARSSPPPFACSAPARRCW